LYGILKIFDAERSNWWMPGPAGSRGEVPYARVAREKAAWLNQPAAVALAT
jgi:hypothetical protein